MLFYFRQFPFHNPYLDSLIHYGYIKATFLQKFVILKDFSPLKEGNEAMQINISNLSEGVHEYNLTEDSVKLGLDSSFHGIVGAHVTLEKSMNQILAAVDASCKGIFICDRCAREYDNTIEAEFTSVYSWEADEAQEDEEDFYILQPDDNIIDISRNVKEYLTLAIPAKLLCNRDDCEIPPHAVHEEEGIDPRWAQLEKLVKREKN